MKRNKTAVIVLEALLLALSAFLTIGTDKIFHACKPMEDGSWMKCHWAQTAVFAFGIALTAMSVIVIVLRDRRAKGGASLAMIAPAVLAAFIPGNFIDLCMMDTMRCRADMKPAVMVLGFAIAAAALINGIYDLAVKDAEESEGA